MGWKHLPQHTAQGGELTIFADNLSVHNRGRKKGSRQGGREKGPEREGERERREEEREQTGRE